MTIPQIREFKLAKSDGDDFHPFMNEDGAFLGRRTQLLEKDEYSGWRPRPRHALEKILAAGYGGRFDLEDRMATLGTVARALNKGDLSLANIALAHARLPALPDGEAGQRMAKADGLLKYDPSQPRIPAGDNGGGRWTDGGGGGAAVATAAAAVGSVAITASQAGVADILGAASRNIAAAGRSSMPMIGELGPKTLAYLGDAAMEAAAPAIVLGALLIPTNKMMTATGTLPGNPGIGYHFDEGFLTIRQLGSGGTVLFSGRPGLDNLYRTDDGTVIARRIDNGVMIDNNASMVLTSRAANTRDGTRSDAKAAPDVASRDDDPEACKPPVPDRPTAKKPPAIAYENFIHVMTNPDKPLGKDEAVRLFNFNKTDPRKDDWVYFDDCRRLDVVMIEAKGPGYSDLLFNDGPYVHAGCVKELLDQATRQLQAADGRPIEWEFAEKDAADYVRSLFATNGIHIRINYMPMPLGKRRYWRVVSARCRNS